MKDKDLKQILKPADEVAERDIEVPDMSEKIKSLVVESKESTKYSKKTPKKETTDAPKRGRMRLRVASVLLAGLFLFGSLTGILFWVFGHRYDFGKGIAASLRAQTAQYLPNIEKLTSSGNAELQSMSFLQPDLFATSGEIDLGVLGFEDFIKINRELAYVDGTGVFIPEVYDVYEIKAEVSFVLKAAPIFDKWFTMPWMDERHGYIANFPYQYWAYYLESDKTASEISVTRVCSRPIDYYELNNKSNKFRVMQWQLMQAKYYFDSEGREVVECYVFTLVTDLKDRINGSFDAQNITEKVNYIPVSIEYLKNVKDSSLTKYYIRFAETYLPTSYWACIDLRGLDPYGSTFDFVQLDYADENDITLLRISGELPVADIRNKPQATAVSFYNKTGSSVQLYAYVHDYFDEQNSEVSGGYPMPGRRDSNSGIDVIKLFADAWPLVTDPITDPNVPRRKYGKVYYNGLVSSGNVTRVSEFYSLGGGSKDELTENVCKAVTGLARKIGADGEMASFSQIDSYLSEMRKTAVDSFDIDKWLDFGKRSVSAPAANNARGEFYGVTIPICNIFTSALSYPPDGKTFGVSASAEILSGEILSNPDRYSFEVALISETGKSILLSKDSCALSSFSGKKSFNLNATISLSDLVFEESGVYTLKYVLTEKTQSGGYSIIFDTKTPVNIFSYDVFLQLEKPDSYRIACEARTIKIIAS